MHATAAVATHPPTPTPTPAADYPEDVFSNGSPRPCPRLALHNLTEKHPRLMDVRLTMGDNENTTYVPLLQQAKYK